MHAYTLASGHAYISSLNEVFMCFQRVEMSLQGVTTFRDISSMKYHFFTSNIIVGMELCYKILFFWCISLFACKACCDFDMALYKSIVESGGDDQSTLKILMTVYTSPAVLRGALFRLFSVIMYPSMGMRCYKKIKQLRRDILKEKDV